jgi:hypothetical protein
MGYAMKKWASAGAMALVFVFSTHSVEAAPPAVSRSSFRKLQKRLPFAKKLYKHAKRRLEVGLDKAFSAGGLAVFVLAGETLGMNLAAGDHLGVVVSGATALGGGAFTALAASRVFHKFEAARMVVADTLADISKSGETDARAIVSKMNTTLARVADQL